MGVERQRTDLGQGPHDWGTESEVGYEMAVHDVEVQEIGAGRLHVFDLFGQARKVRRQQGWRQPDAHRLTHTVMISEPEIGEPADGYWRSTIPGGSPG